VSLADIPDRLTRQKNALGTRESAARYLLNKDRNNMGDNRTLKKIGGRLREESRGLVEAKLPERLRVLVDQIARLEKRRECEDSRVAEKRCNVQVG
jgi:hypothetical protein